MRAFLRANRRLPRARTAALSAACLHAALAALALERALHASGICAAAAARPAPAVGWWRAAAALPIYLRPPPGQRYTVASGPCATKKRRGPRPRHSTSRWVPEGLHPGRTATGGCCHSWWCCGAVLSSSFFTSVSSEPSPRENQDFALCKSIDFVYLGSNVYLIPSCFSAKPGLGAVLYVLGV